MTRAELLRHRAAEDREQAASDQEATRLNRESHARFGARQTKYIRNWLDEIEEAAR